MSASVPTIPHRNWFEGHNGVSRVSLTGGRTGRGNQVPHSTENDAAELTLNKDDLNNHGRGLGVSLSTYGNYMVVGAPGPVGSATDSGKVYVYVRTNNTWQKQAMIMPELSNGEDNFGTSVHLYNGYITAGASTQTVGSYPFAGKAYIYRIADGIWHQQAVLVPPNVHTDMNFGRRVAMNGNTVFVTAPEAVHSGLPDHGKLYFFNRQ